MAAGGVNPSRKLERARARLMMQSPWLGNLANSIQWVPDENLMAFEANGRRLRYRPEFLEEAGVEVLEFVLANAALHRLLGHQERKGKREQRLWQLATDHAINAMLEKNGFFIPEFARGFQRYASGYAESIYQELLRENPPKEEEDREDREEEADERAEPNEEWRNSPRSRSEGRQESDPLAERLEEERLEQMTRRYLESGELPEGIEALLPELSRSRHDWRQELHRYFDPFVKNDYRFAPPNAKHLYRGFSLPSLYSERLEIVVAIDSSGSIDRELMGQFLAELEGILEQFSDYAIELIVADDRIRFHRRFETGEALEYEAHGGGGTDFRPLFEYVERNLDPPRALIYFTDGAGIYPEREPAYDVLWALSREGTVPFGTKIVLENAPAS